MRRQAGNGKEMHFRVTDRWRSVGDVDDDSDGRVVRLEVWKTSSDGCVTVSF